MPYSRTSASHFCWSLRIRAWNSARLVGAGTMFCASSSSAKRGVRRRAVAWAFSLSSTFGSVRAGASRPHQIDWS